MTLEYLVGNNYFAKINYYSVYRIVSSCMQLLVHDMEMACTTAFNAMVKVRGERHVGLR